MIKSKVSGKGQTTPDIKPDDAIANAIEGERAVVTPVPREGAGDPFATFSEWDTEADRRAYASLGAK